MYLIRDGRLIPSEVFDCLECVKVAAQTGADLIVILSFGRYEAVGK